LKTGHIVKAGWPEYTSFDQHRVLVAGAVR
jgi:hypothetical protein